MGILVNPFQRLTSNNTTVFLGIDRDQAANNAANNIGTNPGLVTRFPLWPSLKKFDNDKIAQPFSPFGGISNPDYIWDLPTSDGQTAAFAIASNTFTNELSVIKEMIVFLSAFADNAMAAKIELFENIGGSFVKVSPQPAALDNFLLVAGDPNTPAVGLTETLPYNWQDIRVYSTSYFIPQALSLIPRTFKIVVSFEVTNYLIPNPPQPNPAGLQFIVDTYIGAIA